MLVSFSFHSSTTTLSIGRCLNKKRRLLRQLALPPRGALDQQQALSDENPNINKRATVDNFSVKTSKKHTHTHKKQNKKNQNKGTTADDFSVNIYKKKQQQTKTSTLQ